MTSGTHDASIIIVTYNSDEWILPCIDSLPAACQRHTYEVVIVDNASTDRTVEELRDRESPTVRLDRLAHNFGFARAVNKGVSLSGGRAILLLNPDTVALPGSIDRLLEFAEANPGHGIYGGRTINEDGTVNPSSCWALPTLWSLACFAFGLSTTFKSSSVFDPESMGRWQRDSVREVGMVTGCLLLVDRTVWQQLGGLSERYFVYGEDADLAARARRLGWRPVITPDATIVHAVGASSTRPDKLSLVMAGKLTYVRRQFSGPRRSIGETLLRLGVAHRAAVSALVGRQGGWRETWTRRREWWNGFPESGDYQ